MSTGRCPILRTRSSSPQTMPVAIPVRQGLSPPCFHATMATPLSRTPLAMLGSRPHASWPCLVPPPSSTSHAIRLSPGIIHITSACPPSTLPLPHPVLMHSGSPLPLSYVPPCRTLSPVHGMYLIPVTPTLATPFQAASSVHVAPVQAVVMSPSCPCLRVHAHVIAPRPHRCPTWPPPQLTPSKHARVPYPSSLHMPSPHPRATSMHPMPQPQPHRACPSSNR